ncbi:MAG: T9SS type A sorting domain-containing protein [Bacteroidetes bacterium]|nr:T9SS type A sorting domain-containing protein [Bacteroidota bacterium]
MKKLYVCFVWGLVLVSTASMSQSLSLNNGTDDFSNDTLYVFGTTDSVLLEAHIRVHNETEEDVEVMAKKTEVSVVQNSENTFCWGACFPPFIFESPTAIKIAANANDYNSFIGDYSANENEGTTVIRYTFYNAANPEDSVALVVFYQIGAAGVKDWAVDPGQIKLFPNPANNQVEIRFPLVLTRITKVNILAITGQNVIKRSLIPGEQSMRINLAQIPQGHYFICLSDETGNAHYRKLIISR